MKFLKYDLLIANILVLCTLVFSIYMYPETIFLMMIIVLLNVINGYKLYKLYKGKEKSIGTLNSLVNKKFIYFTYASVIFFFAIYFLAYTKVGQQGIANAYIFYFIFYFFSPYVFNYYTNNQIVIHGDVIDVDNIKKIKYNKIKKESNVEIEIERMNVKKPTVLKITSKEFDEIKLKLNLYSKIKY